MRKLALLSLLITGAACATAGAGRTAPQPDSYRLADGSLVVCRLETQTGSNLRERVCRKVAGSTSTQSQPAEQLLRQEPKQKKQGG